MLISVEDYVVGMPRAGICKQRAVGIAGHLCIT